MHIVDEANYLQFVNEHLTRNDGTLGLIPRDYAAVPLGAMPYTSPFTKAFPIIPESEWPDRIKAMQGRFARNLYTGTPAEDDQDGLPYCWAFSLSQALKAARDADGQPHVDLLAESLGGSVGWRKSGNYCGAAIQWAAEHGFCDRSFSPHRYNLSPSTWKPGWQEEAKNHRVLEWYELGHVNMRAEVCTALVLGYSVYVGLDWAGHAMCFDELLYHDGKLSIHTPNTWGVGNDWILSGVKMIPSEAYVVASTTWSKG